VYLRDFLFCLIRPTLYFQAIQVSIKLQCDAKLFEWVPVTGTTQKDNADSTMRRVSRIDATPRAFTICLAFTISLPTVAVFLPDPDRLLQKGHLSMAKAIASDAKPDSAPAKAMPPARDPKLAVEEEYQMARRQNTVQALELFIARHPDDPLAARARADLRSLSR
jgi:hypothetical protein